MIQNVVTHQAHESTGEKAEEPEWDYVSQLKGISIARYLRAKGHESRCVFCERPNTHLCNAAKGLADEQRVQVTKMITEYAENLREDVKSSAEHKTKY